MASHQVIGIYSSVARARLALEALVVEGLPEDRIAISVGLTDDGIAAEAPGQPYFNQPSDRGGGWHGSPRRGGDGPAGGSGMTDAVQQGACVVTAEAESLDEADRIRDIMEALRPVDMRAPAPA